jgi:hypothetical protein
VSTARGIASALGTSVLAALSPSAAAADAEPIRIEYRAPASCPGEADFAAQVTGRTTRARLASPGETARTFTIEITASGGAIRGKLTIDKPRAVREVKGGTCDEVISALGLVTALAIDPRASTAPKPPPPPPPSAPSPPPPPPKPREHFPPPPRYAPLPWYGPIADPLPALLTPAPEARWRVGWGLHFGGASAIAPSILPVLGGFVAIARDSSAVLAPSFRLAILRADSGWITSGASLARFAWTAARAEGCPIRLEPAPSLGIVPCVHITAGALDASGISLAPQPGSARPWVAPGLLARVAWDIVDRVFLEAEGGVDFPLIRDTFYFAPANTAHAVPVAGGSFGVHLGTHFDGAASGPKPPRADARNFP